MKEGVNKVMAELIAWSLKCATVGKWPQVGFYGEMFEKNTTRQEEAGKPLAGGYKLLAKLWKPMFLCFH